MEGIGSNANEHAAKCCVAGCLNVRGARCLLAYPSTEQSPPYNNESSLDSLTGCFDRWYSQLQFWHMQLCRSIGSISRKHDTPKQPQRNRSATSSATWIQSSFQTRRILCGANSGSPIILNVSLRPIWPTWCSLTSLNKFLARASSSASRLRNARPSWLADA